MLLVSTQLAAGASNIPSGLEVDSKGRPLWESRQVWVKVKAQVPMQSSLSKFNSFSVPSLDQKLANLDVRSIRRSFNPKLHPDRGDLPDLTRIFTLEVPDNNSAQRMVKILNQDPNVEYAERVPIMYTHAVPNDISYSTMYHLPQIQAEAAWDKHKGENGDSVIVIGISDSGVDWKHPDLAANIYNNLGEDFDGDGRTIEWDGSEWTLDSGDLNGEDDDGNGYPDDLIGWNFMADALGTENNDPMDPITRGHGSHVAGLAAGVTNNQTGISSISWNVKILSTSHSYEEEGGDGIYNGYQGLIYLADNGADIINASWGGGGYSQGAADVISYIDSVGSIFLSSAGNDDDGNGGMVGYLEAYPASFPGVISVASVSRTDEKAWYSTFGWWVDISAPGGNHEPGLISTVPYGTGYDWYSGTSMASPLAAGMFALVKSYHPDWSNEQIINQVLGTADDISPQNAMYTNWLGTGRINAYRALTEENVSVPNELKLALWDVNLSIPSDEDIIMKPGESLDIDFVLRNYSQLSGDANTAFTLKSSDPDVLIAAPTIQEPILADDFTSVGTYQVNISAAANTEKSALWLVMDPQDANIVTSDSIKLDLTMNSLSLSASKLNFEVYVGDMDTNSVTITNSAASSVQITPASRIVNPNSLLWHVSNSNVIDGTSWWCGDAGTGGYIDETIQYLDLPPIDLNSTTNPELTFRTKWSIEDPAGAEAPYDGWDGANVWISTDRGETFSVIEPLTPAYTCRNLYAWGEYWDMQGTPGWAGSSIRTVAAQFDLSSYSSDEVIIRFGFASDGGANDVGIIIDDITIKDGALVLYLNSGVFEGGIQLNGRPSSTIPTPWLTFTNLNTTVPGDGDLDLEFVIDTEGMDPGSYSTTVNVELESVILGVVDIRLDLLADPSAIAGSRDGHLSNLPGEYALEQNFPNPFNPTTIIRYALPEESFVSLNVYDITGREINTLLNSSQGAGWYSLEWNGTKQDGSPVSTGVYFARIQAGSYSQVIKMVYLR